MSDMRRFLTEPLIPPWVLLLLALLVLLPDGLVLWLGVAVLIAAVVTLAGRVVAELRSGD
jgi:hypothetical protein